MKKKISIFTVLILVMSIFWTNTSNIQAATSVSTVEQIKTAIANNEDIEISGNIVVNETIQIPNSYTKRIFATDKTLSLGNGLEQMFEIYGANVSFEGITFDANKNGRIFKLAGGQLSISQSTLKNGKGIKRGGLIEAYGATTSITIEQSNLLGSEVTYANEEGVSESFGGAIFANGIKLLRISKSAITNNFTTEDPGQVLAKSMGGAFHLNSVENVEISESKFEGNHTASIKSGPREGGAVYMKAVSIYRGQKNTFKTAKSFNTGGALLVRNVKDAVEFDSDFIIPNLGDAYGISGGSISTENSNLTILKSRFVAESVGTKVIHAGGFITVVGEGKFILKDSEMTGSGTSWNGPRIATFGGAIAFESDSQSANLTTVDAVIENTVIKNVGSEETGAISVGTRVGYKPNNVKLLLKNVTLTNNRTNRAWDPNGVGGALYVGPGNTVTIEGGTISQSFATRGGAIYNEGTLTITGGANISNNTTYQNGGGIFNNGVLTVDNANLALNRNAENRDADYKDGEMVGGNIYAKKDVTITPNAILDANDVRVLDKESAIILTGPLTRNINVSISEKNQPNYEESERYIGYTVAKGTVSKEDANKLHYVTMIPDASNPLSDVNDITSLGKWDFVFNPENNTVVVGQRAKVVYDANGGQYADASTSKAVIQDVYKSNIGAVTAPETPTRDEYRFLGWFNEGDKDNIKDRSDETGLPGKFNGTFAVNTPQTTIINPAELRAYAGWLKVEKFDAAYRFEKAAGVIQNLPTAITDRLNGKNKTGLPKNTEVTTADIDTSEYADTVNDGKWTFVNWNHTTQTIVDKNIEFVGTWTFTPNTYKATYEFVKKAGEVYDLPQGLTDRLNGKNKTDLPKNTEVTTADIDTSEYADTVNDGKWTLVNWNHTTQTIVDKDVKFVGTWAFTPNTYKATYEFIKDASVSKDLPQGLTDRLNGKNKTGLLKNAEVTTADIDTSEYADTVNDGKWTLVNWNHTTQTIVDKDVKFVGTWTFTPNTYKATYEFVKKAGEVYDLPQGLTNRLVNSEKDKLVNGDIVTPNDIDTSDYVDSTNDGTWTFVSWDVEELMIIDENVKFVGTWRFLPNKHKAIYEFVKDEDLEIDLPQEITNRLLNSEKEQLIKGDVVGTDSINVSDYEDSTNDGVWLFVEWDFTKQTIVDKNVKFVGTWTFLPNEHKATYEFIKDASVSKDLPRGLLDRLMGSEKDALIKGDVVGTDSINVSDYVDTVNDGKWTFVKWDQTTQTIVDKDVKFVGTWTFTPNTYKASYEFKKDTSVTVELPQAIVERLTGKEKAGLAKGNTADTNGIDTSEYVDTVNDGKWTFVKWDQTTQTIVDKDVKFVGTWTFGPNPKVIPIPNTPTDEMSTKPIKKPVDTSDSTGFNNIILLGISLFGLVLMRRKVKNN